MWFERRAHTRIRLQALSGPGVPHAALSFKSKVGQRTIDGDRLLAQVESSQRKLISWKVRGPDNEITIAQDLP